MQKKTSIDGLVVRTSGRRVSNARPTVTRSRKVMDVAAPSKATTRKTTSRRKNPIDEFGAAGDGFSNASEDWSDLLGEMNEADGIQEIEEAGLEEVDDTVVEDELGVDDTEEENQSEDKKSKKQERKAAKKAKKQAKKAKRKHPKLWLFGKILLILIVIAIVVFLIWGDWIISRLTAGNSGIFDAFVSLVSPGEPFKTDEYGRTNVLVFGTEGYDMEGTSGDGKHDGAALTDSIMIVSFDQETKDVALISLPRDLKVRAACSAGKVNEVFWCNNQDGNSEEAGAKALMEQVGEIFGLDFQYWVHVNWGSVVQIVDTLGGITVTLDEDINDRNYTGINIKAGEPTHLTGIQAVALARARHGTAGGDFSRGNSQQKIVQGIIQKIIEEGVDVTEAFNLINILGDNLRSNFAMENIRYGVNMLSGFDLNNIRQVPLIDYDNNIYYVKTATINGISYVIPYAGEGRYTDIQAYVDRMLSSNPAVREGAKIAVYNATTTSGLAGAEEERLKSDGFDVVYIGDAPEGTCNEKYCVYVLNDTMNGTRAALTERYQVEVMNQDTLPGSIYPGIADVVIVIGQSDEEQVVE